MSKKKETEVSAKLLRKECAKITKNHLTVITQVNYSFANRRFRFTIPWDQIDTQAKALQWIQYLTGKGWVDAQTIWEIICCLEEKHDWEYSSEGLC